MPRRAQWGFTFIEMMVVMAIVAIGAMLAIPMIEAGVNSREVRRVARQIYANINHCRSEAIATGAEQSLKISPSANRMDACGGRWVVFTDRAVIQRIEGGSTSGDGSTELVFFPNGSATWAHVVIASRKDPFGIRLDVELDPLLAMPRIPG